MRSVSIFVIISILSGLKAQFIDKEVTALLNAFEPSYKKSINKGAVANYNHQTNITAENAEILVEL